VDRVLRQVAIAAPGFLAEEEGLALYRTALATAPKGPFLEIGGYCGKSAIYLGAAARSRSTVLYSLDHHRGSEEQQPGAEYFDPTLVDQRGRIDSLPMFRRTIAAANLEDVVVAVVGRSSVVAGAWATPLALLFVDGGHSEDDVQADLAGWLPHLKPDGLLAVHDVFPNPAEGGQAPYHAYLQALESGFVEVCAERSLRVLARS